MVYKNIYQVAEKPISEEDYITSDSFLNHSFIGKVADCVKIAANRNYEIEMLAEWLESNRLGKIKGKTLTLSGYMLLSNYFYENFKGFKQTIKALDALDEREFMDFFAVSNLLFTANRQFNNTHGVYIYTDSEELLTMDEFLRTGRVDTPYYIGGVCQYHF
jgi:hypothetical protein